MKPFLHVKEIQFLGDYRLYIRFNDGLAGEVDLQEELYGEVFAPLKDKEFFVKGYLNPDTETIEWPNGADFAPEFLHEKMGRLLQAGKTVQ